MLMMIADIRPIVSSECDSTQEIGIRQHHRKLDTGRCGAKLQTPAEDILYETAVVPISRVEASSEP